MEIPIYKYNDWADSTVIYCGNKYVVNPFINQDSSTLTIDDFESINTEGVNFDGSSFKRIQKTQKATHQNHSTTIFKAMALVFSGKFKKQANKYCFVKDEFFKLEKQFVKNQEGDIPDTDIYSTTLFGYDLTGHQIHEIRQAIKDRFYFRSQTYDHIHSATGPFGKFNETNIYVLTDAINRFYYWLKDLYCLFEKNHNIICTAANFNPNNPGLADYINIIEAYYTDGLFVTVQAAFEETYGFKHLHLANTEINEFHIDFIAKRIRKLRMIITEQARNTKKSKRSEFINPLFFQLSQILSKANKRLKNEKVKSAFNTDNAVIELLQTFVSEMEILNDQYSKKKVVTSTQPIIETKENSAVNSLMYKHWAKDGAAVNALYKAMMEGGEILHDTIYEDFKNAFSNKKVKHKIALTFTKGWAFYFFRQLKDTGKIEENDLWIGVANAFYLSSDPDYDMKQLAFQKAPKNKAIKERINTLINSF